MSSDLNLESRIITYPNHPASYASQITRALYGEPFELNLAHVSQVLEEMVREGKITTVAAGVYILR